jgi:hypothetical protein
VLHRGDIGRAGFGLDFEQRAALEVDAEIQSMGKEQRDGENRQRRRDRKTDAAEAGEVELGVVGHDTQRRQQVEAAYHRQHRDQDAEPYQNEMCHSRPRMIKSARFAAASTAPSPRRSDG